MHITVAVGLGLALAASGRLMLFDPASRYAPAPWRAGDGAAQPAFTCRWFGRAGIREPCPHRPRRRASAVAIALWLVLLSTPISRRMLMLTSLMTWLIKRRIGAFERMYSYDASYLRDILAADVKALVALFKVQGLAEYRKGVP